MAKLVWVYTLGLTGVSGLSDVNGIPVGDPKLGMVYAAEETNGEIADDGSKPLYHAANGIIDPNLLGEVIKTFNGVVTPPVAVAPSGFSAPTSSNVTDIGAKISWTAPSGGDPVVNYEVTVTDAGVDITNSPFTMAGVTLNKVLSGLTPSTDYEVTIKAINGAGNVSSTPITVSTIA